MRDVYTLTLNSLDVMQIIDALESRAEAYEKTAAYFRNELDDFFLIEECNSAYEAERIAESFRAIVRSVEKQRKAQQRKGLTSST